MKKLGLEVKTDKPDETSFEEFRRLSPEHRFI